MHFESAVFKFLFVLSAIEVSSQYHQYQYHHHQWRIIDGSATTIDRYPIIAQLLLDAWGNQIFAQHCSGVVLTARHVISTAHCFQYNEKTGKNYALPRYWKIRVGSSYRTHGGSVYTVKTIIHHPHFNNSYYINDIAVLVVERRMDLNANVRQGTLVKQGVEIRPNSLVEIVGWGLRETGGVQPDQLQKTTVFTVDYNVCKQRYDNVAALITDSMLCAGKLDAGGPDGCFGDSGGPLIYKGLVAGLVSFGYSCGHRYYPGVYTKISYFSDWIVKTILPTH